MLALYALSSMPGVNRIINQGGEQEQDFNEQEQEEIDSLSDEGLQK